MGPLIDQKLEDIDRYIVLMWRALFIEIQNIVSSAEANNMQKVFDKIWIADCLYHQEALGAVRAEREGDGSAVFICQADEWRSRLCHVCQAAEPTVLHAAACQRRTTGEVNTNFFFLFFFFKFEKQLHSEREVPTLGSLRRLERKDRLPWTWMIENLHRQH